MGLIFFLSHQSSLPGDSFIARFDKILHATEYAVLSLLFFQAIYFTSNFSSERNTKKHPAFIVGCFLTILYGLTDEYHQSFIPGRCFDWYDLLADSIGALLVWFILTPAIQAFNTLPFINK
jgi:VanZ family protein